MAKIGRRQHPGGLFGAIWAREIGLTNAAVFTPQPAHFTCDNRKMIYRGSYDNGFEDSWIWDPPYSLAFSNREQNGQLLAFGDEAGFLSITDARKYFSPTPRANEKKEIIQSRWKCHSNAIFDVNWTADDRQIFTASGDRTIACWDSETSSRQAVMLGSRGTVKSVSLHPSDKYFIASGCRNGTLLCWDMRQPGAQNTCSPVSFAIAPHGVASTSGKPTKRDMRVTNRSVTSVLFLNDGVHLMSGGASNKIVKLWDLRNFHHPVISSPELGTDCSSSSNKGITSLSMDNSGTRVVASCTDDIVYLLDPRFLENGNLKEFTGGSIENFYVKAKISPDGSQILCGSAEGTPTIWQVEGNGNQPTALAVQGDQVTAVDWCKSDSSRMATLCDDSTVAVWDIDPYIYESKNNSSCAGKSKKGNPACVLIQETGRNIDNHNYKFEPIRIKRRQSPSAESGEDTSPESARQTAKTMEVQRSMILSEGRSKNAAEAKITESSTGVHTSVQSRKKRVTIEDYFKLVQN